MKFVITLMTRKTKEEKIFEFIVRIVIRSFKKKMKGPCQFSDILL